MVLQPLISTTLLTLLLLFLPSSACPPHIPPQQLITSKQSCLSNVECLPDQYCKPSVQQFNFRFFSVGGGAPEAASCQPRLQEGSECSKVGVEECARGTYCGFSNVFNFTSSRCLPQAERGAHCPLSAVSPCRGDLKCEIEPVCRPFSFGREDEFCAYDRHCQQDNGIYCRASTFMCSRKRPPGAPCGMEASNFECDGFCVTGPRFSEKGSGICQRAQRLGESCTNSVQCGTYKFGRNPNLPKYICNRSSAKRGVCVLETDLIPQLGAPCNPDNDTCDARRGLSCGRVGSLFKCMQLGTSPDSSYPFCTPHSPLSRCPPDNRGNLRECRRALNASKQLTGMFMCRTRRQVVPLGNPCNHKEFAVCEPGALCMEAPGVLKMTGRFALPPLRTCMRLVPVGAPCGDPFRFTCAEGSFCVNGTCQRTESPPDLPVKYAPVSGRCSQLLCPPGTVCFGQRSIPHATKFCTLPARELGLGQPCYDSARFREKCKKGLFCSRNIHNKGIRLCRPQRGIGGLCENDDSCIGDLECDPSFRQEPFQKRCFDPLLSLSIGDKCNPYPGPKDPRCVAAKQKDVIAQTFYNTIPLSCLPKNGTHICQWAVGFLDQCSFDFNVSCATNDLVCSEHNVCIPKAHV